jgi:hypothetical protein
MSTFLSTVESSGRAPIFWMLVALVVTFMATRIVTRRIRAGSTALRNWNVGGVHLHHQVFGVIVVMVCGCLEFAYRPPAPWVELTAAGFGAGVSLTLDEFALWLHLDDVYWTPQGRASIDAVFCAIAITGLLLLGATPLDISAPQPGGWRLVVTVVVINLVLITITALKGKPILAVVAIAVPTLAIFTALRLAKPGSVWANRRYRSGSKKLERAESRFGPRYVARWNRLRDLIGGAPSEP